MPLQKIKHNTELVFVYCVISMKRACFSFKKDWLQNVVLNIYDDIPRGFLVSFSYIKTLNIAVGFLNEKIQVLSPPDTLYIKHQQL